MEKITVFIEGNLFLNFLKNNMVLITFLLSVFNFFIRLYDRRFKLKYELYDHALIKSVDAKVGITYKDDKQYVSVLPIVSILIENCSSSPITITCIILEDSEGNRIKSKLEPGYLTTTMSNYFDLKGEVNYINNHIYTDNFPIKIEPLSSGLYRFRLEFIATFVPVKAYIQTNKKTSRLRIIEGPLQQLLLNLKDEIDRMNKSLSS